VGRLISSLLYLKGGNMDYYGLVLAYEYLHLRINLMFQNINKII